MAKLLKVINGWYVWKVKGGYGISVTSYTPCLPFTFKSYADVILYCNIK